MKILRIAGRNLASLGGEFELDFVQEPLASAGLFAICGPTGAGKSTLLDALCLALYDATPRLSRAGSKGIGLPDVRDETVTPQDTRNLLRRGTADGYAEVDFIGNDSKCYRARWSVRRARAKADGALQQVAMSLHSLPERQQIGGTNREVKAEIESRIGLNFEQFTRAVLLAQNEFSAFLRADDGDRGELLETLTGTAIYSTMSKRAFERAKLEQQTLNAISQRLADQAPLDAQSRLELERDGAQAHDALMILEQRKGELETQLRWHAALEEARRGEEEALREAERLASIYQGMEGREKRLILLDEVQPARAMVEASARIASAMESIRSELDQVNSALTAALQSRQDAQAAMQSAEHAHDAALQAQMTALPDIGKAKALDAQLAMLLAEDGHAEAAVARLSAEREDIQTRLHAERKSQQEAEQVKQTAERWLSEHESVQPLALQWPRWDSLLNHAAVQLQTAENVAHELAAARDALRRASARKGEAEALLSHAARAHAEADMQRLTSQFESASHSRSALRQERQELESRREILEDGARVWAALHTAKEQQSHLQKENDQLRAAETEAAKTSLRLGNEAAVAKAAYAQAEKALVFARMACSDSVENLRNALKHDVPCPVCGSTQHPYAENGGRLHSMLAEFETEAAACRARHDEALAAQVRNQTLIEESRRRAAQVEQQLRDLGQQVLGMKEEWAGHLAAEIFNAQDAGNAGIALADEIRTVRDRLQQLSAAEADADQSARRLEAAQQALDAASALLTERRSQFDALSDEVRQIKSGVDLLASRSAESNARLTELLDELNGPLVSPGWQERWRRGPEAFRSDCEQRIAEWREQCRMRDENNALLSSLEASLLKLQETMSRNDAERQRAVAALEESRRNIGEKRTERSEIFGGKNTALVEDELSAAVTAAKTAMHEQTIRLQECAITAARLQETISQAKQRLAVLEMEQAESDKRLADWMTQFSAAHGETSHTLDIDSLRELLTYSLEWMAGERSELHSAFTAMQTAKAIHQERMERRAAHEQERIGKEDAAATRRLLDELMARFEEVRTDVTRKKLALAEDDSRRQKSAALLAELERQQSSVRLWGQLAELIGSADGKKFRNYAQQFTLDVLLGYANRHLQDLVRRYRLERVKDTLALLVVDQDMGDEVRSIHSLSGGESFLVSLALALGLASLSSNRVRVESLFIDEGFGSLDADTLSIAMHALDSLQSQGRKVGVITHVQEMSERIGTKVMVHRVAGGKSLVRIESESLL